MRLLAAGQRPISNVVDASNYVMVELGKPIHTFDAAAVHDGRILVRRARPGERFETLDHVERELDAETLVIADPAGPIGIAGVMGGAASEIGDGTTDVVVESAIFDPISIRRTAFRYALRSDASLRFEKGQETRLARVGADRTARLIGEWAGGVIAPGVGRLRPGRAGSRPASRSGRPASTGCSGPRSMARSSARCSRGPGSRRPRPWPGPASGSPPARDRSTWRRAGRTSSRRSSRPGAAISRSRGTSSRRSSASAATTRSRRRCPIRPCRTFRHDPLALRNAVRDTLVGAGLTEVVTYALVAPKLNDRFPAHDDGTLEDEPEQRAAGRPVVVTNPLSSQHSVLRQSLVGSLLEVVSTNLRVGRDDVAIFEVGKGYGATGTPPTHEWWRLGFALTGAALPADLGPAGARVRPPRREGRPRAHLPAARLPRARLHADRRRSQPAPRPGGTSDGRRPARRPGRGAPSRAHHRARPARRADLRRRGRDRGPGLRTTGRRAGDRAVAPSPRRARPGRHRGRRPPGGRGRGGHPPPRRAAPAWRRAVRHLPRRAAGRRPRSASPTGSSLATTSGR